ncbi:MAG: pvdE [Microvirga sp.]|nr:pvdE [Microvirga sp.]
MFYEELLPDMKWSGKTLIVISHDDRYFYIADRMVRLAAGRIVPADAEARSMAR